MTGLRGAFGGGELRGAFGGELRGGFGAEGLAFASSSATLDRT